MALRWFRLLVSSLTALMLLLDTPRSGVQASHPGVTTLLVGDEEVEIYRDEFGVPHVFAVSSDALFEAYGYTVAQDRLWQLETNQSRAECA